MTDFPAFFTIAPPPPELQLGDDSDDYRWHSCRYRDSVQDGPSAIQAAVAFPEAVAVDPPEALRATPFACSGSLDSSRYRVATTFRAMPDMGWEEARIALNRLLNPIRYGTGKTHQYVALAEFVLTATGFTGFVGRRGEHAVKLRDGLGEAIDKLRRYLDGTLQKAERQAERLACPITQHGDMQDAPQSVANSIVRAFWAMVPTAADEWVRILDATPDQAMTALDYLRATLARWDARRPVSADVLNRLAGGDSHAPALTAAEYAEAIHIADMLVFTSEKLLSLYAGIIYSMPIYRLYPATSEAEAIALWWPWGRPAPLVDGGPPRPPKPGKQTLDPSLITATRPQDIVREVMQKTGINRTTVQRMTATMRTRMRQQRKTKAAYLLRLGHSKSEVARKLGLSASRISAMFKGEEFSTRRRRQPCTST
jgi:hypothetical protein